MSIEIRSCTLARAHAANIEDGRALADSLTALSQREADPTLRTCALALRRSMRRSLVVSISISLIQRPPLHRRRRRSIDPLVLSISHRGRQSDAGTLLTRATSFVAAELSPLVAQRATHSSALLVCVDPLARHRVQQSSSRLCRGRAQGRQGPEAQV